MIHLLKNRAFWLMFAPFCTGAMIIAFLSIWSVNIGTAGIITITSSGGTISPITRANLQKAFDLAKCGDVVQIEAGAFVRTGAEVQEATINGATMTITTPYPHHFISGEKLKITGLAGAAATLNKNQFSVTSVPEPNLAVLNLGARASASFNGTYKNAGMMGFARGFQIKYDAAKKNCKSGNEIIVTTTKNKWLPDPDMRITPSYKPLLPTLQLVGDPLYEPLVTVNDKVTGLKFVGVGFEKIGLLDHIYYSFFDISSSTNIDEESQLAQNISFDRNLFYTDHQLGNNWKNTFNLRVKGFEFTNNFVDDLVGMPSDGETYISAVGLAFGPFNIRNNYVCCAIGIPFLWGARDGDYALGNPVSNDILVEHNSFYTSPKHYPTSPTYVGDAHRGIVKNCSELKGGINAVFRFNTCENQFSGGGAQWYGFTFTARGNAYAGPGTCSLDGTRTVITCPQLNPNNPRPGHAIGVDTGITGSSKYEWRTIASINSFTRSYTVSQPYSGKVGASNLGYAYAHLPFNKVDNVLVHGNYFKNVASMALILGEDSTYPAKTENIAIKNNLMVYDSPLFKVAPGLDFFYTRFIINEPGKNYQFTNNTSYVNSNWKPGIPWPQTFRIQPSNGIIDNIQFHNNLMPYDYIGADSAQTVKLLAAAGKLTGSSFRNNTLVGSAEAIQPCKPSDCSGNFIKGTYEPKYRNPEKNDFSLVPGSAYTKAGTDGKDLGVNIEEVAIIRELTVKPGLNSLVFNWRVPLIMQKMGCQLEVSADSNLTTDLGSYVVVNALRPDYFIRADSDRSNKRAKKSEDGLLRTFQVGQDVVERDDNGQPRNLALTPNIDYFYRLMCGGATERGTVRTLRAGQ